jgi:hypothetical protein
MQPTCLAGSLSDGFLRQSSAATPPTPVTSLRANPAERLSAGMRTIDPM